MTSRRYSSKRMEGHYITLSGLWRRGGEAEDNDSLCKLSLWLVVKASVRVTADGHSASFCLSLCGLIV